MNIDRCECGGLLTQAWEYGWLQCIRCNKKVKDRPHYIIRRSKKMLCNKCGKEIGDNLGTPGNYFHCKRVKAGGKQILLGYLFNRFDICTECWDKLVMPFLNDQYLNDDYH